MTLQYIHILILCTQHHGISPDQLDLLTDTIRQMGEVLCKHIGCYTGCSVLVDHYCIDTILCLLYLIGLCNLINFFIPKFIIALLWLEVTVLLKVTVQLDHSLIGMHSFRVSICIFQLFQTVLLTYLKTFG